MKKVCYNEKHQARRRTALVVVERQLAKWKRLQGVKALPVITIGGKEVEVTPEMVERQVKKFTYDRKTLQDRLDGRVSIPVDQPPLMEVSAPEGL